MNRYKLVTIITKEMRKDGAVVQHGGLAVRIPKALAAIQVAKGLAVYTSKGRYKHIVKEQKARERRELILESKRKAIREGTVLGKKSN